ncbi:MAG: guanitoxin biosynthesis L-enduracididine beta-hydroxylase GntD [Blastocatellia bacterium]
MNQLVLSDEEVRAIKALLAEIMARYTSAEDSEFLKEAAVFAHELPRRLRKFLVEYKVLELPLGVCLISGFPVDDSKIGPTPMHWEQKADVSPALEEEILLVLMGSILGEVIAWLTQQNGYVIHEVLPIREFEDLQINFSSKQYITWHTEDAFHEYRGDYLALMCLRNLGKVATTFASSDMIELDPETVRVLFEPHFIIHPDESHSERHKPNLGSRDKDAPASIEAAYELINHIHKEPQKVPVLFGDPKSPYLRLDPYVMEPPSDDEALRAFNLLTKVVDERLSEVVLQPGDILFIDNYRVVHGRKPFVAKYDGSDRWLKRINIARDLRKSRGARTSCTSRVIL